MANSISNHAIFGEYKNPEDKVTAALLQVLHYGGHEIVDCVFDDIDLPSNEINVAPQVNAQGSRPDGLVSCDCKYKLYIESKIASNALNNPHGLAQISANRKLSKPDDAQWMVYITPDASIPKALENISEIIWINWQTIVDRLKGYESQDSLVGFLIEQFCLYVEHIVFNKRETVSNDGVIVSETDNGKEQRVIIVGGHWGEEVALKYGFYASQNGRYFLPARYLAFYHKNRIENLFEIEDDPKDNTILTSDLVGVEYLNKKDPNYDNGPRKYFKLKHIHTFNPIIINDSLDRNGKVCAFTYNQRYTTYESIMKAEKTSDLAK